MALCQSVTPESGGWRQISSGSRGHVLAREAGVKTLDSDFPGGPVVKNLPCNVEDEGSIPGWGSKILHAPGQGSPRTIRSNKRAHVLQDPTQSNK